MFHGRRVLVLALVAMLVCTFAPLAAHAQGRPGPSPQSTGCTPNPCPPRASVSFTTLPPTSVAPESGNFSYQLLVVNIGDQTGAFDMQCSASTNQLPCVSTVPASFSLARGASQTVIVTFRSLGLGKVLHKIKAVADFGKSDSAMAFVTVTGPTFLKHANPLDRGPLAIGDTLRATYSHPSGINTASFKLFLDGRDSTSRATVTSTKYEATTLRMQVGTHTWTTYGCASNGRCDSLTTTFSASEVPPTFALDDSLPLPVTEPTIFLLPGALPLPVDSLRGCPRGSDDPEIRLSGPFSYFFQGSLDPALQGFIFLAAPITTDSLAIISITVDHKPGDGTQLCNQWVWLNENQYDWNFWEHSDPNDPLWDNYPYGDRTGGGPPGGNLLSFGGTGKPDETLTRQMAATGGKSNAGGKKGGGITPQIAGPGAIKASTYKVVLNGTTIISGGAPQRASVRLETLNNGGSTFKMAPTDPLLNIYDYATPTNHQGGWNEIIASIEDSTGHRSYVRSRFVMIGKPPAKPLALTPLRDFTHQSQEDCAAFGAFQCGAVEVQQEIPGFVSRDKNRSLHLVYRSGSQKAPTFIDHRLSLSRYQAAPDSLQVEVLNGAALLPGKHRYAGAAGVPNGPGVVSFQFFTNERRILAAEVAAPLNGKDSIRTLTTRVRTYYPGPVTQDNTVVQDVVQLQLTDTNTTRFGGGWQLAELNRLVVGQNYQGAPAAIWISGDGSYTVFRKVGGVWVSPPGENGHLVDSTATNGLLAKYVLFLENGASIGFSGTGFQKHTSDLLGNLTTYAYVTNTTRLSSITDPAGTKFEFQYNDDVNAKGQVTDVFVHPTGQTATKVVTLTYDASTRYLISTKIWRSATAGDVTQFGYVTGSSFGALLSTITDPRSTVNAPIVTTFSYDAVGAPVGVVRPPERIGQAIAQFRDQWRRAAPRIGFGRSTQPLERVLYESQLRGTSVDWALKPTDFTVDAFGSPTLVRRISPPPVFTFPFGTRTYGGDDVRLITRDAIGRVVSVVHAPDSTAITDSVHYDYDALNRVKQIIRTTAKYAPNDKDIGVDIVTFTYDSVTLSTGKQWCSRLLKMQGVMGVADTTVTRYGASGVARCLPTMVIGVGGDTTKFGYGTLAAGQTSATRPTSVTPQVGPGMTMQYDAGTWNSKVSIRTSDNATTTAWYSPFGRPDSVKVPDGVRTWIQYDLSGRVLRQKTGSGLTAPTTATTYDASGNVIRTDVYPSPDNDLATQSSPPQTTLTYYDRLNRVDSVISPGTRPNARKQSYIRDVYGNPFYEFSGNGAYVGRVYDWQGRLSTTYHSFVDPSRSVDGEQFGDADARSIYNFLSFTIGPALSAGQQYLRKYDNKGNEVYTRGQEVYLGDSLYARKRAYSRRGLLIADTLIFMDGLRIARAYQYDRRGLRTQASDVVTSTNSVTVDGDASGQIDYTYDLAGRLLTETGQAAGTQYARARWLYDLGGRDTLQGVLLDGATNELITRHTYDGSGRDAVIHTSTAGVTGADWYDFSFPVYDVADQLKSFSLKETHTTTMAAQLGSATLTYAADGTRRLKQSSKTVGNQTRSYTWTYDAVGNQTNEVASSSGGALCTDTDTMTVAADNRLLRRWSPSCPGTITRYWSDQAGNRLATADSINTVRDFKSTMSYTAANQLYYTLTPTASVGSFDLNWHWYDADGMRIVSHVSGVSLQSPLSIPTNFNPNTVGGWRSYNFYDGSDVALVIAKSGSTGWVVRQRFLSSGADQPLAGRFRYNGVSKNLALLADRIGTTMVAVQPNGTPELNAQYFDRSPFGSLEGATGTGGTVNPETGFGGATTPNQSGGFTYLRNRWYDPQTGRFLTQDPIGLAGGVNLYAYAGNNPVMFTDPFGLTCKVAGNCTQSDGGLVELHNERKIEQLHPSFQGPVRATLGNAAQNGVTGYISVAMRSNADQERARAAGRSNAGAGQSYHQYGLAVDVYPYKNGRVDFSNGPEQQQLGHSGEGVGLTWGGRWRSPYDPGHLELRSYPIKDLQRMRQDGQWVLPGDQ